MTERHVDSLGHRIRRLRKGKGLTQEELASGICSKAFVSQVERDLCQPSLKTLTRIAHRLGVDVTELIGIARRESLQQRPAEKSDYVDGEAGDSDEIKAGDPTNSMDIDRLIDLVSHLPIAVRVVIAKRILETIPNDISA